ncbi:hypothetical protein [Sphingomonas sp. FW199]
MAAKARLIDLGMASAVTLGSEGMMPDLVRSIPQAGLSED